MNNPGTALVEHFRRADRAMLAIASALFIYSLLLAAWRDTWLQALLVGGGTLAMLAMVYRLAAGTVVSRIAMAAGFMVFTALHINQADGMIEMHFGVFVLLALLLFYRDWLPIVVAAAVIAVHHLAFFYLQLQGAPVRLLAEANAQWWVVFMHAGYVVVETIVLCWMAQSSRREADQSMDIMQVTEAISGSGQIDLTGRSSLDSPMSRSFNDVLANLEQLVRETRHSTGGLNDSGHNLAGLTRHMHDVADLQQRETEQVAAAVEEMSAAIRQVAHSAEEASAAADRADRSARSGHEGSQSMGREIDNLAAQIGSAAQTVGELDQNSARIGSVLDVIRGIAEQTNLLALNAAIEAARAGDLGRGFAVVADEVRTLASRTQQSTAEIQTMILTLQTGSRAAVEAMSASQSSVEICVRETQRNGTLLQEVSAAVNDISRMNSLIATSTYEQSAATNEIAGKVDNIRASSTTVAGEAERVADAGSQLLGMAQQLGSVVSRFHARD
jgi:methyl-accepting chemotaxis protein